MARYLMHVRTPMSPSEAFAYMADLNNFAKWDPGVDRVVQVHGDGGGAGAAFDVRVKAFGHSMSFNKIGNRAGIGLVAALAGERVPAAAR